MADTTAVDWVDQKAAQMVLHWAELTVDQMVDRTVDQTVVHLADATAAHWDVRSAPQTARSTVAPSVLRLVHPLADLKARRWALL